MGLMDVLNGMQNGPRGQRAPSNGTSGGGVVARRNGNPRPARLSKRSIPAVRPSANPASPGTLPTGGATNAGVSGGGGISDLLKGGLGGLLARAVPPGSVLSGGLQTICSSSFSRAATAKPLTRGWATDPTKRWRRTIWPAR